MGFADRSFTRDARGRTLFLPLHLMGTRGVVVPDADAERRLRRAVARLRAAELTAALAAALGAIAWGVHWAWAPALVPIYLAARALADRRLARGLAVVPVPASGRWSLRAQALRLSPAEIRNLALAGVACGIGSLWLVRNGPAPGLGYAGLVLAGLAVLTLLAMLGLRARSR